MFREISGPNPVMQTPRRTLSGFGAFILVLALALCHPALPAHAADKTPPDGATAVKAEAKTPAASKPAVGTTTGLPLPRFVSLKSNRINVRRGPGSDNQISWVFKRKGLPVEIVVESGRWRKIRDHDGATGWVWHSMLDGRRSAIVMGLKGDTTPVPLFTEPSEKSAVVAYAEVGVIARLPFCQDEWCELQVNGYEGWVKRALIWGTYPGENFE